MSIKYVQISGNGKGNVVEVVHEGSMMKLKSNTGFIYEIAKSSFGKHYEEVKDKSENN